MENNKYMISMAGRTKTSSHVPDKLAINPSVHGVNINDISNDTISITSGDTYLYTVDTAPGTGRTTLTVKTVGELFKQITSPTCYPQTYEVKAANGMQKELNDRLVNGDVVMVTADQERHDYTIKFIKGAVRGKLQLVDAEITANTSKDVSLNFIAGMRSPATEVVVKLPKGFGATMDNTTVNVIGRGEVKLSELATQSVGRVGAGYRFQQVGTVAIENHQDGSQVMTFKGLDLRPDNGPDLQITFKVWWHTMSRQLF